MVPLLSALSLALCHEVLEGGGYQQIRKKKLPLLLTPFAIHCLTKATAFVPQCENNGAIYWSQLLLSHITWLASLAMQCETPKAYAMNLIRYKEPSIYSRPRIWIRSLRSLFTFASFTPYARFARYPNSLPAKARMRGRQIPSPCSTSYSFASLALTSSALPDLPAPRLEPYIGRRFLLFVVVFLGKYIDFHFLEILRWYPQVLYYSYLS